MYQPLSDSRLPLFIRSGGSFSRKKDYLVFQFVGKDVACV